MPSGSRAGESHAGRRWPKDEKIQAKYIELMAKHYTIQCKCGQCGCRQAVKVSELITGQRHCRITHFRQPKCNGELEFVTENREESIGNAIALLGYFNLVNIAGKDTPSAELLDTVVDDVGCWSERDATPQEMGWVGQNGLP